LRTVDDQFGLQATPMDKGLLPGSDEWIAAGVSGSRIAAIMGKSQYECYFSWWHYMAGNLEYDNTPNEVQERGTYIEPALARWFADHHPEFEVHETGTWQHPGNPKHIASPDRILVGSDGVSMLECKTATRDDAWGEPGSNAIPDPYLLQVQWNLYVLGLPRAYVAVQTPYLGFAEYVVERDDELIAEMVAAADAFLDSLPTGSNPQLPSIDGHTATYEAIKKMHPLIEEGSVEVPAQLVIDWLQSQQFIKAYTDMERRYRAEIADLLGPFKTAVCNGYTIGTRQAKRGGTPYLKVANKIPTEDQLTAQPKSA
jgi:putative phage-type endonuclease